MRIQLTAIQSAHRHLLFTSLSTAETSPVTELRKIRNKRIKEQNVYNSGQETNFFGG
jgi:hypothetical protein